MDKVMVRGGMSSILENLTTMAKPPKSKFTYDDLIEAVEYRIKHLKLPYCGSIKKIPLENIRINPNSYSGFISGLLAGKARIDSFPFSFQIAKIL